MLLYHARGDELIPFELGQKLAAEWCGRGVNVRFREVPGADHSVTATAAGNPIAIDWLAARFASGPPARPRECPAVTSSPRCIDAGGVARGARFGPTRLGRTRSRQRRVVGVSRLRGSRGIDRYCVRGGGKLRIGYPTRRLSPAQRRAARGRAVLILTSSSRFSVRGVAPGNMLSELSRRLRGERRFRLGRNTWYLARGRRSTLIYKVRGARVLEVGIASRRLTRDPAAQARLLRSFR